jgi:hypothetical protein
MSNAQHLLAEALARIEHKVDALINEKRFLVIPPLGDFSHVCPVCKRSVQYMVDQMAEILIRKCGCTTGKQAPIKLMPIPQRGERNDRDEGSESSEGSTLSRRDERGRRTRGS